MYTLVDFVTQVKGIEYILSLLAIGTFLVLWEILKPRPFSTVASTGKDDLQHIQQSGGARALMKSVGKIAAAPFIGLAYVVMLPFGFFAALAVALVNVVAAGIARIVGKTVAFEWRPMEAYLAGRKKKKEQTKSGTR